MKSINQRIMKKKALSLKTLKVDSFVTSMESKDVDTVKGGFVHTCPIDDPDFYTTPCNCNTSIGQICYDIR
ncbi:MAG: pinensin family lanthipeptide [Bacteroidota bacterium]